MSEQQSPTPDPMRQQIELLSQIATHPALRQILTQIQEAPPQDRLATAERLASIEQLEAQGVNIPEGLRVTTRYFEDPDALLRADVMVKPTAEQFLRSGGGTLCVSVGEIVCVSYGWEALQ